MGQIIWIVIFGVMFWKMPDLGIKASILVLTYLLSKIFFIVRFGATKREQLRFFGVVIAISILSALNLRFFHIDLGMYNYCYGAAYIGQVQTGCVAAKDFNQIILLAIDMYIAFFMFYSWLIFGVAFIFSEIKLSNLTCAFIKRVLFGEHIEEERLQVMRDRKKFQQTTTL